MRAQIAAYDAALRKRFVATKRHTIEVDFHTYRGELERERRTRAARPSRRGCGDAECAAARRAPSRVGQPLGWLITTVLMILSAKVWRLASHSGQR